MSGESPIAELGAVPERLIRRRRGLEQVNFAELWRYRELFLFLAWRDILVRYKQTYLGIAWAVLQPLLTVVVFTVLYGKMARFPDYGVPYSVLALAGLLPWQFFATAITDSSNSLLVSTNMISKIYFPRLIIPLSSVLSSMVDFAIGFVILVIFMVCYGVPFRLHLLWLPVFQALALLAACTAGVWLSALNVKYRDVKYVVPFFVRIGFLVSPVGFISSLVAQHLGARAYFWYAGLNPIVGVIDGYRWAIFGGDFTIFWPGLAMNIGLLTVLAITGLLYFRNTEKNFADII